MNDIEVGEIKVRILEAIPLKIADKRSYLLSLQIVDGDYYSPIVRKELRHNESLTRVIKELVDIYKQIKPILMEGEYAKPKR